MCSSSLVVEFHSPLKSRLLFLAGSIPQELGNLEALKDLAFWANQLSGESLGVCIAMIFPYRR